MQGLPVRVRVPYKAWLLAKKLHSHCPAMQSAAMDSAKPSVTKRICQPELGDIHCFQLGLAVRWCKSACQHARLREAGLGVVCAWAWRGK